MATLSDLKRARKTAFEAAREKLAEKTAAMNSYVDNRFWKPSQDKSGNGVAIIRFLPSSPGEEGNTPWVEYSTHVVSHPDNPKSKFFCNCPETFGYDKRCPLCVRRRAAYKQNNLSEARNLNTKRQYVFNILVVNDPASPENNGKNFLYKCGQQIFDIISQKILPSEEELLIGREAQNVFDFWEGSDFELIVKQVDGFPNYKASSFRAPKPLSSSDAEIEAVWNRQYNLQEFLKGLKWETNEALAKRYEEFLRGETLDTDHGDRATAVEPSASRDGRDGRDGKETTELPTRPNKERPNKERGEISAVNSVASVSEFRNRLNAASSAGKLGKATANDTKQVKPDEDDDFPF
jgi:hypothetical protein